MALPRPVPINVLCVEEDVDLRERLKKSLAEHQFAQVRDGTFLNNLPEIEKLAASSTTFLYLDPYAIEGLEWDALSRLFGQLRQGKSIEILLNFSAISFVRRALAALAISMPIDAEEDADGGADAPSVSRLNAVVGGDWWRRIVERDDSFSAKVNAVTTGFCDQLRDHFREVCEHPIRAKWDDVVPKYSLIFGSRSPDALILMNDATIKSRDLLAEQAKAGEETLFETRPKSLVPDRSALPAAVLTAATRRMTRKALTAAVIRQHFCGYTESEIRQCVKGLLDSARLQSATGKSRINDEVEVWRPGS